MIYKISGLIYKNLMRKIKWYTYLWIGSLNIITCQLSLNWCIESIWLMKIPVGILQRKWTIILMCIYRVKGPNMGKTQEKQRGKFFLLNVTIY